jgi:hypothetical protein
MTDQVKEITCPACERVWPTIAEQGIVTELYGQCYACVVAGVVKIRDERAEDADYTVQNCSYCGGLQPKVSQCVQCGGKGWETTDKPEVRNSSEVIAYPH